MPEPIPAPAVGADAGATASTSATAGADVSASTSTSTGATVGAGADVSVSVVVIVYNDAERLPHAVRSALAQTLRAVEVVIVDDGSTDRSYQVARDLAAAHPDRVRAFRLPANSGGCGAPRNHGVRQARGRYVMFLDSDDRLEANACRNVLDAAERTGADLVSGRCVRVHLDSRSQAAGTTEWYPWLYDRSRTLESIAELPDLLAFDTLSTNKCYRREFLLEQELTFPVGIHYEDLLFSARAYLAAERIALIPAEIYYWNVRESSGPRSISNRRHEIANFAHRIEIHRRIDALLQQRGLPELKLRKDIKFLKHDLVLHLRELPFLGEEYRRQFAARAKEYLAGLRPEAYQQVRPIQAICAYLLAREDWDNLLPATDTLINPHTLSSPLAERDGRIYWCADHDHLDDPEGRRILDVTDAMYAPRHWERLAPGNQLTGYCFRGGHGGRGGLGGRGELGGRGGLGGLGGDRGRLHLTGRIVNPLGRITSGTRLRGQLEFRALRPGARTVRCPLSSLRRGPTCLHWEAEVDLAGLLRPVGLIDDRWEVWVVLEVDGALIDTRPAVGGLDLTTAGALPVRPRLTRLVGDRLRPEISSRGHLVFRLSAEGRTAARGRRLVDRAAAGRAGDAARAVVRTAREARRGLHSRQTKLRVYREVLCRLPVRKGLVVFESHLGTRYSDSPKAIYEEMLRQGVAFQAVWSYAGPVPEGFPQDATLVRRWSWPYLRALAQAEFWIDNQGFPSALGKRPATTYLQTWHGSALKLMGSDSAEHKMLSRQERDRRQRALDRFDHFLVRTEHDVRTLGRAFGLPENVLLRTGYPRNDALVAVRRREEAAGRRTRGPLAAELGIPADRTVLLYAPTFRGSPGDGVQRRDIDLPLDAIAFAERFGDRYVLLVRAHYLDRVTVPPSVRGTVIDVTDRHDVTPLLALADALITDYSSVMFDYALLDRPMLFYAYDYDSYAGESRGTYFDLRARAPGPVVGTQEELFAAVDELKTTDTEYGEVRRRFAEQFAELDDGSAARRIVGMFFTPGTAG